MKTILVCTDLSERSDRAIRRALRLARAQGAACHVLHVVDDDIPAEMIKSRVAEAKAELDRFIAEIGAGADVHVAVVAGDVLGEVPARASDIGADLVVLGLHRRRALLDGLRQTTMERLVTLLRTPILLVHDHADHDYAQVLAATSFSPACASAIRAARLLAPEAGITAIHAIHLPFTGLTGEREGGLMDRQLHKEARADHARWCAREEVPVEACETLFETGSFREVIDAALAASAADVLAMGTHTRSRYMPQVLGSFVAELTRDPPCDLLLAHP